MYRVRPEPDGHWTRVRPKRKYQTEPGTASDWTDEAGIIGELRLIITLRFTDTRLVAVQKKLTGGHFVAVNFYFAFNGQRSLDFFVQTVIFAFIDHFKRHLYFHFQFQKVLPPDRPYL